MLLAADGRVVSAEELLEHVWDANLDPFSNIVSVTVARLRRKLGEPPGGGGRDLGDGGRHADRGGVDGAPRRAAGDAGTGVPAARPAP
jgi:hypothetical protein